MKKIKYLLGLCLVIITLTGCVKFNANMDIKKDKSMDFSIVYAFDKTVFGEDNKLKEEDFNEVKKQGFTVTKYSEGNFEGFTLTKKINNIDEVSTESDVIYDLSGMMQESESNYMFKVLKGDKKNTYTAKFNFNANDSGLNATDTDTEEEYPDENENLETTDEMVTTTDDLNNIDLSGMMDNMDLSFNVTLPNSAISSNATTKENDNKKLSWKLNASGQEYIEFSFELDNNANSNLLLYVGIGVIALIIIILIVLLLGKKNKKEPVVSEVKTTINSDLDDNIVPEPVLKNKVDVMENKE